MADNRLGENIESTKEVCRMLTENCILKKLNLSGNGFTDRDAELIITALEVYSIKSLLMMTKHVLNLLCIPKIKEKPAS